jgi:putative transposase
VRVGPPGTGPDPFAVRVVFEAVEYATLSWVDWFNNRRILEPIGNITPAEAEQQFYSAMDQTPMAA